jgi:uncharacterized protein YaiI (UPF0178 family)
LPESPTNRPVVWVDADACPGAIKELLFRTALRLEIETTLVANQSIAIPKSELIHRITVPNGADIADNLIVERMAAGDVVITGDIPLASRVVEKGGIAIGTRGELFDDASVHGRLATRNLMEQFRSAGVDTSGPKPQNPKDIQTFANQLDRTLSKVLRKWEKSRSK